VAILANGQAGNAEINDPNSPDFKEFQDNLLRASIFLAKEIVRDGEGIP
jgi:N-acetylglutamate synthase/N-acetylornithine aminotransferase